VTTLDCDKPYQWFAVLGDDPDFTERDAWFASVGLLYWMDKDGGNCYPSQAKLARRLRYTDRTVRRMLTRFQSRGWLRVVPGGAPGRIPTDLYVPCLPVPAPVVEREPETASPVEVPVAAGTPLVVVPVDAVAAPVASSVLDEAMAWSKSPSRYFGDTDELPSLFPALSADELESCRSAYQRACDYRARFGEPAAA
jgi:hypothetical protein